VRAGFDKAVEVRTLRRSNARQPLPGRRPAPRSPLAAFSLAGVQVPCVLRPRRTLRTPFPRTCAFTHSPRVPLFAAQACRATASRALGGSNPPARARARALRRPSRRSPPPPFVARAGPTCWFCRLRNLHVSNRALQRPRTTRALTFTPFARADAAVHGARAGAEADV